MLCGHCSGLMYSVVTVVVYRALRSLQWSYVWCTTRFLSRARFESRVDGGAGESTL